LEFFLAYNLELCIAFYLTYILTFCPAIYLSLAFYLTFSLACVRAHACPAASGDRDRVWVQACPGSMRAQTSCELRAHWCPQSPRAGRGRRCRDEEEGRKSQLEEGVAPLSKTREPHLAGGEQSTWISTSHGQVMAQRQRHSTRRPIFAGCWKLGSAGISCPRNLMALNNPLQ